MVLPPVLSLTLSEKLATLGDRLAKFRPDDELEEILAELAALPANEIVRASKEINAAARLGWWHKERKQWGQWSNRWPEWQLLRSNPNYAWLFLFHFDGFVREAALDAIHDPPPSPFFFAALAWRLNDWAEPVRRAARRCAERVLPPASVDVAANAALYLLDRRLVWGRWRDEPAILDAVIERQEVIEALVQKFLTQATGPFPTYLRHLLRYSSIDVHLPRLASLAKEPLVRAIAYRCLISGRASWVVGFEWVWIDKVYFARRRIPAFETREIRNDRSAADVIREATRDRSAIVRRAAADELITARSQIPDAASLIAQLAKDSSPSVRWRADYMLRHPVT